MKLGDRRWRVRGLAKNTGFESLKVNLLVAAPNGDFHVDLVELYSARHRSVFVQMAAAETGLPEATIKKDLGQVLLRLEHLQDERLTLASEATRTVPAMSSADEEQALQLLRSPDLLDRIVAAFDRLGIVGEHTNRLVGYLAVVSRKTSHPLALLIQSGSAAGKSTLMDAILGFVPDEERVLYSAMTGQSLFYVGEGDLRHKVLAIVEEQGARRASYALKILQSEGALTIASTGKDPTSGRLVSQEYRVEGPVMIMLTTTAIDVDDELLGRCLVLTVDESPAQTKAIHERQRQSQSFEGLLARDERERIIRLHHNAQRLLRPRAILNPLASDLDFGDYRVRARRDHRKLLSVIEAVALLHQYQRRTRVLEQDGRSIECIEVTEDDVAVATTLFRQIVGDHIDDLPPQTTKLLGLLAGMVTVGSNRLAMDKAEYRFTRRQIREELGWGNTATKRHLGRLVDAEFVIAHGSRHGRGLVYELAYAPEVEPARSSEDGAESHCYDAERSHHGHPKVTPWSRGGQGHEDGASTGESNGDPRSETPSLENARLGAIDDPGVVAASPSPEHSSKGQS